MKMKLAKWLLAGGCALLAACAFITVNVYFPEKAAKEAYKSLDDMLLENPSDKQPEKAPGPVDAAPDKPQTKLFRYLPDISLVSVAHAEENQADDLAIELASMPEVEKAYKERKERRTMIKALFNSGAVGLSNQGLVSIRDKAKMTAADEALVNAENQNRKTIITGMAKATLKITKQPETKQTMDQALRKSATTYAETRRDVAKKGWWIQLENGRWIQK